MTHQSKNSKEKVFIKKWKVWTFSNIDFQWSLKNDHWKMTFFSVCTVIFSLVLKKCHFKMRVCFGLWYQVYEGEEGD